MVFSFYTVNCVDDCLNGFQLATIFYNQKVQINLFPAAVIKISTTDVEISLFLTDDRDLG